MSLEDVRNVVLRSLRPRAQRGVQGPNEVPENVSKGGTTGGPNNYGQGRSGPVFGELIGRQWRAPGGGTSQQLYVTTRQPRRRA